MAINTLMRKLIRKFEVSNCFSASQPSAVGMAKSISAGKSRRDCHNAEELITPNVQAAKLKVEKTPIVSKEQPSAESRRVRDSRIQKVSGARIRNSGPILPSKKFASRSPKRVFNGSIKI